MVLLSVSLVTLRFANDGVSQPPSAGCRLWILRRTEAARCVNPVSLNEILATPQRHVVFRAVGRGELGAEGPRALIGIFPPSIVIPGVQVGIGDGLFQFVCDDRGHAVRSRVAVWSG